MTTLPVVLMPILLPPCRAIRLMKVGMRGEVGEQCKRVSGDRTRRDYGEITQEPNTNNDHTLDWKPLALPSEVYSLMRVTPAWL